MIGIIGNYFNENFTVALAGTGTLKLNSTTYSSRQFVKKFESLEKSLANHIGKREFYGAIEDASKKRSITEAEATVVLAELAFQKLTGDIKKAQTEKTKGSTDITKYGYNYANKVPVIDRRTKARMLYDDKRKCIDYGSDYESWKEYKNIQPKEIKELMNMAVMVADIYYDPFEIAEASLREVNGQKELLTINAHVMPKWRLAEVETPELPKVFDDFMAHLFPDEVSREYVYHWLYFALTSRNYTYLLLHGDRGVGKNTFAIVCRLLLGLENFSFISSGFFDSRFNGELKNIRMGFFDEHDILSEHMSVWKQLPETYLTIEEKGMKPEQYRNHASFIVANNFEAKIDLLGDERKFSVPILGSLKVDEVLGQDVLEGFLRDLADDGSVIANIGWYILKKYKDSNRFNPNKPLITDLFHDIVEKALTNWQRGLIETIETREEDDYELDDLENILKGTGRTKIEKFLATYRDREGSSYGYVKQKQGGIRTIIPSDKYAPDKSNFNDEEF